VTEEPRVQAGFGWCWRGHYGLRAFVMAARLCHEALFATGAQGVVRLTHKKGC